MQTSIFALIGTSEAIVIGIVFLVLFGAKKVPELMKGLGTGMREFKKASRDIQDELERASQEPPAPAPAPRKPAESVPQASPTPHVQPVSADAPAWSKPNP